MWRSSPTNRSCSTASPRPRERPAEAREGWRKTNHPPPWWKRHCQVGEPEFHGVRLHQPDWSDDSHTLALTVSSVIGTRMVHAILNSHEHPLDFELPPLAKPTLSWRRVADTALDPPDDVADLESAPPVRGATYRADAHSVVLLCADLHDTTDAQHTPAL